MKKMTIKIAASLLCILILMMSTIPPAVFAGKLADALGITNDVPSSITDDSFGIGSGLAGDPLIEAGEAGLKETPGGLKAGASYVGGGILKWGGYYIGAYDTTQDTIKLFTEGSKHNTTTGKVIDKSLAVVKTGMGWAVVMGGVIVILTVTATAPATGTLAVVTGTGFALASAGVGLTRAIFNTETVRNVEDLMSGSKKLVFAPYENPNIKEGRNIIKEELGFDPYDRSWNEIPDPNTGIPVYKPNIYIYSDRNMTVNVRLSPGEWITRSIPAYDMHNGWDAKIFNGSINGRGDYLFYEALVPDNGFQKKAGWIINKFGSSSGYGSGNPYVINLSKDLSYILDQYKFNDKEKADFLDFWCGKLDNRTSYAVFPQGTQIVDNVMPLDISPLPAQIYRIWFYFVPVSNKVVITAPVKIQSIRRGNYTVVEWGGLIGTVAN